LRVLGERAGEASILESAVLACHAALEEASRDRMPSVWADSQDSLGHALLILGKLEGNTKRLQEAVTALRMAQEEPSFQVLALEWSTMQANLGIALAAIAEFGSANGWPPETTTAALDEAAEACQAALKKWPADTFRDKRQAVQHNLDRVVAMRESVCLEAEG